MIHPFFACGNVFLRVIKTLFKEQRAFLILNNSADYSVSFEKINVIFHVRHFNAILINEDISKDKVNFRDPIIANYPL